MKFYLICPQCTNEHLGDPQYNPELIETELTDKYLYEVRCSKGHTSVTWLQQHKFETLIDTGLWALNYGMPDSAFLKFYAAFEDFRKFFIRGWLHRNELSNEEVRSLMKGLPRSELQKGAFDIIFGILMVKEPPETAFVSKEKKWTEIRNNVAHNGYLLTEGEAKERCQEILHFITDSLIWARKFMKDDLERADIDIMLEQNKSVLKLDPEIPNGTSGLPSVIGYANKDIQKISIDQAIEKILSSKNFVSP